MEEYPVDFLPTDASEHVFTTHIKDPEHFYVHVESRSKILDDIMETLADRYYDLGPSDKVLPNIRLGSLCAAKFTDDNNWYRAKITGLMKTGMIEVQFVDYGNTDYVSADRVKSLDPDLVHYPVQCYRCALADVSCSQGYWTPESTIKFEDKTMDQRCEAYFSEKTHDDTYLVYMIDGEGNSLNEMFGASQASRKQKPLADEASFNELAWEKGAKVQATVAYVQTPDLFWCQDQSFANELLILSEELSRLHMTQEIQTLTDVKPGMICAAKFSEDEAWYRGVVTAVSSGAAQVYFVDYGNTESVPLDLICKLSPGMRTMPALAAKCSLLGISSVEGRWEQAVVEQFEELVVDKEFEMKIIDRKGDTFIVSLIDIVENSDVSNQMRTLLGMPSDTPRGKEDINSNNNQTAAAKEVAGIGPSLTVGSRVETFLTWVDSPGDFWVQLKDFDHLVEKLSNELQAFYSVPRPSAAVSSGAFVVALYSADEMWYRGLILKEVSVSEVLVLFIDYGNSDIVSKTNLRQVAPAFGEVVPLAFRCALVGIKSLSDDTKAWTADAKNFLEEMTQDGCMCEVVDETESRKLVQMNVNGKDVARELVALRVVAETSSSKVSTGASYAKYVTVRRAEREPVVVSHVASPQNFWCQLSKNFEALDRLMEQLDAHYSDEGGMSVKSPAPGTACVAQYSEDNAWYRGKILDVSLAGFTVHFVDYGNSEVVPGKLVCEAEPRFLDLPVQGVQCSLPLEGDWSHLTCDMSEIVMDKEITMEVLEMRNDVAVVELYEGTLRISDHLKKASKALPAVKEPELPVSGLRPAVPIQGGSTVQAFTSFVVSPSKFYIQLAEKEEELGSLMDDISLQNAHSDKQSSLPKPHINQACMALFSEDNQWYRGVITSHQGSMCKVLFVDYGNEESVSTESLRVLPPELGAVPVMAYECSLEGTEGVSWSEQAEQFFESLIMDQELQCTFASSKSVKVTISGKDVKKELESNGYVTDKKALQSPKPFGVTSGNPQTNGGIKSSLSKDKDGWDDADDTNEGPAFGSASNKTGFGNRDRNVSGFSPNKGGSGFGSKRAESGSSPGSRRDEGGFGSNKNQSASGFGGAQRERKTSSGSSAASGEFTYPEPPAEPEAALLVHMDEDGTFYLQLPSMEKDILFLAKRLAGSYKNGGGPRLKDSPAKGVVCCSKFPEDGCMYRCLILDVNGGTAILRYVDYGNIAECSTRDLKMLFPDLLQYSVQAFPCKLKGLTWSVDQAEKFAAATLDKNLEVTFSGSSPPFEVEVKTPSGDLLDILTGKIAFTPSQTSEPDTSRKQTGFGSGSAPRKEGGGFGASSTSPKTNKQTPPKPQVCEQKYNAQVVPGGKVEAYICHIDEKGYFYLQLEKDTAALESIMAQLEGSPGLGQHPNPSKNVACAAIFSEDSAWYRAQISSIEGDSLTVTFVDYGNGDKVQKSSIKPLTSGLLTSAPLSFQSQFSDIGPLSEEAQEKLSTYLMEHKVTVSFTSKSSPPFSVEITDSKGNDLQEIVCPSDCYKIQVRPTNVVPAGVTHIEDDGRFYVQLYADYPAIVSLQQKLSETATSSNLENLDVLDVGSSCCFMSGEGTWHRGNILKVADETATVINVDNGKSCDQNVKSLHKLPLEFFKSPPYGYECRLRGVESWTEDLREKFTEMTEDKILNATFYTGSSPFRVSLARSIELDLLGLSAPIPDSPVKDKPTQSPVASTYVSSGVEAYISHVDPDGTLYIQTVAREEDLNTMSEKLESVLASAAPDDMDVPLVDAFVCAKFTEDDAWYRAQVTASDKDKGQASVRFVDYGNTDSVGKDRLAALPEEFELSVLPAFARRSWLSGVSELSDENVEKLKAAVQDQVVTVETCLVKEDCDEVLVKVAGTSMTEMLNIQITDNTISGAEAYVSHVDPDGTLYIQTVAREEDLNTMSEKLESVLASAAPGDMDVPPVGAFVCAKFTEDDAWYRAQVTASDKDKGQASVRFVDYGNTDSVGKDRLAALPEEFELSVLPAFARRSWLSGVSELSDENVEKLKAAVQDQVVTVETSVVKEDCDEVLVKVAGTSLIEILNIEVAKSSTISGAEAYISHVDPDGTLYIQTVAREEDLNTMSEKLESVLASAAPGDMDVPPVGAFVCAKFTEDDAWYRAQVTASDKDKGQASVRFVDYGNTDSVGKDRLAALPEEFELSVLPAFARRSWLSGVSELLDENVEKLKAAVQDQVVTVEASVVKEDCDEVLVKVAGTSLIEMLKIETVVSGGSAETSNSQEDEEFADASETQESVAAEPFLNTNTNAAAEEFADAVETMQASTDVAVMEKTQATENGEQSDVESGSRVSVTISYVVTPSQFYFQLDKEQGRYNTLMDQMFEHYSSLPEGEGALQKGTTELSVGDLCAALYAEDESWYRVTVKDIADDSYTIFFMDHGNTELVEADSLRVLPEQFKILPPGAKEASLAGIKPAEEEWSSEAVSEFKERVEEKSLLADILGNRDGQALLCLLELGIPVHEELIKKGHGVANEEEMVMNKAVQRIFSDTNESSCEALTSHLEDNESDIAEKAKTYRSNKSGQVMKIGSLSNTVEELKDVLVYISHVESPALFWCQPSTCVQTLKTISDLLGATYSVSEELIHQLDVDVGDLVVAKSSQDGLLYRSKVLCQASSEDGNESDQQSKVSLQFIDFGTKGEAVKNDIYKIEDSLCSFPAQAFCCSLENIMPQQGDSWPQEACQKFSEIVQDVELSLKLVGRDQDGTLLVQLVNPETSQPVSSLLLDSGFGSAVALESMNDDVKKCQSSSGPGDISTLDNLEITHPILESTAMVGDTTQAIAQSFTVEEGVEGRFSTYSLSLHTEYNVLVCNDELPNSFHIRLMEMDAQFHSLVAEIEQYVLGETDENKDFSPEVNDSCLVMHMESWHRATLMERKEAGWNVRLQDSGKELCVNQSELRKLPQHLLELPAQAIPCYLAGIVSVEPEWCSGALEFFKDKTEDGKFCMYILEDAHKGKYGVCINELDSTESGSVNRAMVDLGYAEVVPGSYIDIQFEMEKTLDTEMLNELEESFNEVSLLRCNTESVRDGAVISESGDVPSFCDSYKESEISKSCKQKVDSQLYQLLQVTDSSLESSKTGTLETAHKACPRQAGGKENYVLAVDVERIEQHGCPDVEASDAEEDYLGVDAAGEKPSSSDLPSSEGALAKADHPESEKDGRQSDSREERKLDRPVDKEEIKPASENAVKDDCTRKSKTVSPPTRISKPIYTWKVDTGSSRVEKSVVDIETHETKGDKLPVQGEEAREVEDLENSGSPQGCKIDMKIDERRDDVSEKIVLTKAKDCPTVKSPSSDVKMWTRETSEHKSTKGSLVLGENSKEERTCSRCEEDGSSTAAHSGLDMEWEDLFTSSGPLAAPKTVPLVNEYEEVSVQSEDRKDESAMSSTEGEDRSGSQTPSSSVDSPDESFGLEQDMRKDKKMKHADEQYVSETKCSADFKKRYMSSTPSRNVKTPKALKRMKMGHIPNAKKSKEPLAVDSKESGVGSEQFIGPLTTGEVAGLLVREENKNEETLERSVTNKQVNVAEKNCDEAGDDDNDPRRLEVVAEPLSVTDFKVEKLEQLKVSECKGDQREEDENAVDVNNSLSEASCSDPSVNDTTQFISCVELEGSDVSHADTSGGGDDDKGVAKDLGLFTESNVAPPEQEGPKLESSETQAEAACNAAETFAAPETSSATCDLNDTVDEYESCSETGPEDEENYCGGNFADAMRRNIVSTNLSTSSVLSEASVLSDHDISQEPASLLLSGSSFESSALTDDPTSFIETEAETGASSQHEEDSSLLGSVSSSSSCSCTSCDTQQQEPSSSFTAENALVNAELEEKLEPENLGQDSAANAELQNKTESSPNLNGSASETKPEDCASGDSRYTADCKREDSCSRPESSDACVAKVNDLKNHQALENVFTEKQVVRNLDQIQSEEHSLENTDDLLACAKEEEAPTRSLKNKEHDVAINDEGNLTKISQTGDNATLACEMNVKAPETQVSQTKNQDADGGEDDSYYEDPESKTETETTELCADEEVLAAAPILTLKDDITGTEDDPDTSLHDENKENEPLSKEVAGGKEVKGEEESQAIGEGTEEESQC